MRPVNFAVVAKGLKSIPKKKSFHAKTIEKDRRLSSRKTNGWKLINLSNLPRLRLCSMINYALWNKSLVMF